MMNDTDAMHPSPEPVADPGDTLGEVPAATPDDTMGDVVAIAGDDDEAPAEEPVAKLIVKRNGAETSDEFVIRPPAIIGRFDAAVGPIDVDLGPLPEGAYVSRKHAKITYEDGVWRLEDLGSSNGSFILRDDFERVESADLNEGDEFALGNARFVFRLGS